MTAKQTMMDSEEVFLGFDFTELEACEKVESQLIEKEPQELELKEISLTTAGKRYQYWKMQLEALKFRHKEILQYLEANERLIEKKLEYYERGITSMLPPGPNAELTNDDISIFYRASDVCDLVGDLNDVPEDYIRTKVELDKVAAKRALKAGGVIPGVRLSINYNLQVKPGGLTAKVSSRRRLENRAAKVIGDSSYDN